MKHSYLIQWDLMSMPSHRNCWKCGQKNRIVWWRCAWSYELAGLCPGFLHAHTNWQNYAEIYHFSVLAINHLSQIVRLHTCMSSIHILDTFGWQLASMMLKCNYGSFFPNNIFFLFEVYPAFFLFIYTIPASSILAQTHTHTQHDHSLKIHFTHLYTHNNSLNNSYRNAHTILSTHEHGRKVAISFKKNL